MIQQRSTAFGFFALIVALNYFAFRTEMFADENQSNHPDRSAGVSLTLPTLNWETFDKDNASQAFILDAEVRIEPLCFIQVQLHQGICSHRPIHRVRDKSPPQNSFYT